jgi:hypothetical protein
MGNRRLDLSRSQKFMYKLLVGLLWEQMLRRDESGLGYRLEEPALGNPAFPGSAEWTSGYDLASGVDVLIHDAQYSDETYTHRIGWGHTSVSQLATYANLLGVEGLVTFHHDPWADDADLDVLHEDLANRLDGPRLVPGMTGLTETV